MALEHNLFCCIVSIVNNRYELTFYYLCEILYNLHFQYKFSMKCAFVGKHKNPFPTYYIILWGSCYIMRSSVICTPHQIQFRRWNREEWDGRGMWHVWGRGGAFTGFRWWSLGESEHLEDPGVDGRIILRGIFRKWDVELWTGSSWLRIGTGGRHFWMR